MSHLKNAVYSISLAVYYTIFKYLIARFSIFENVVVFFQVFNHLTPTSSHQRYNKCDFQYYIHYTVEHEYYEHVLYEFMLIAK